MKHIKKMKIDIDKKNFEIIPSVQYDSNTRFLHINLSNGSIPFDLTGCSVKISGTKQDGTAIFNNCTIINAKKGFVEVELTEQMNAVSGTLKCELKIYYANGVLTTKQFSIVITSSVTSKEITSGNEFKALTDALTEVQGIDNKFGEVYEQLDKNEKKINSNILDNTLAIVDMHYKILKGTGWVGEDNTATTTTTNSMNKKTTIVIVSDSSKFILNQLILIKDNVTSEYHINKIKEISGNNITLFYPVIKNINTGATFETFYNNSSHPRSQEGYKALAEECTRDLRVNKKLLRTYYADDFTIIGGNSSDNTIMSYTDLGGKLITLNNNSSECRINFNIDTPKSCIVRITYNPKNTPVRLNIVNVAKRENGYDYSNSIYSENDTIAVEDVFIQFRSGVNEICLKNDALDSRTFELLKVEIFEVLSTNNDNTFKNGTHILMGDSWIGQYGFDVRLIEKYPSANIENWGVPGNNALNIKRRMTGNATNDDNTAGMKQEQFDSIKDLTKKDEIDFLWIVNGTNNYLQGTSPQEFNREMSELASLALTYKCKVIMLNSSIGEIDVNSNLSNSREYCELLVANKNKEMDIITGEGGEVVENELYNSLIPFNVTIPQNGAYQIGSFLIEQGRTVYIDKIDWTNNCKIKVGFASEVTSQGNYKQEELSGVNIREKTFLNDYMYNQYFTIFLINETNTSVNAIGGIQVKIKS